MFHIAVRIVSQSYLDRYRIHIKNFNFHICITYHWKFYSVTAFITLIILIVRIAYKSNYDSNKVKLHESYSMIQTIAPIIN